MNRWAAFATVAALFLSGVAIGALGMHVIDERRIPQPPFARPVQPRAAMEHLERLLDLSAEQREAITAVLERSWRDGEEIRREIQPRVERHVAETERQVRELLTPAQRERFDELHRGRGFRHHRLFLGPPGFPGPPPGHVQELPPEGS